MDKEIAVFQTTKQRDRALNEGEAFSFATVKTNKADPYLLQGSSKTNPMLVKVEVPEGIPALTPGELVIFCNSNSTIGLAGNEDLFEALAAAPKIDRRIGDGFGFTFVVVSCDQ